MTFQVGRLTLRVHETPGHSPGHVVFEVQQPGGAIDLFVGDTLFAGSIGRTDLPGGDYATLIDSITRVLLSLPGRRARSSGALRRDDDWKGEVREPVPAVSGPERAAELTFGPTYSSFVIRHSSSFVPRETTSSTRPARTRSPGFSASLLIRSSLTNVPFVLSRSSSSRTPSGVAVKRQ